MRMKKPAVALATAALMTLAACGGGGGGGTTDGQPQKLDEGGAAGSAKDPDAEGPLPMPEGMQEGGTITVGSDEAPTTFDPTRAYYTDSTAILTLVTRALTQYVYRDGEMVLVPDLATDLGRPNSDNTEWTFTLKKGLKYEDGSPVEPEDVAYAVKRSFAIEELPEGPTYNLTYFLDGDTYKGPFQDGDDYRGVEVNGMDITIKMARPFAEMDYLASFPQFGAIPQEKDNPETYGNNPLATGPYKFSDYKPGTSLTLVKNDQWDPATDPGRIQAVDTWQFNFGEDLNRLQNEIINDTGEAQTTVNYDNTTPATYRAIQEEDPDRLVEGTSPCTYYWAMDQRRITELKVRQAVGWAFPYRNYWRATGAIEGVTRDPSPTLLPPGTNGRKVFDALGNKGIETDPQKAKDLLAEAGYKPGEYELSWFFENDDPLSVAGKDQVVEAFEKAGFATKPVASTTETIRTDESDNDPPVNMITSSGWCSDWPTGGSWFPAQWDGDLVGQEGRPNPSMIKEPELDKEQDRIIETLPAEETAAAWGEFDELMMTKYYPAVLTGYSGTAMIHGSKVGGMENDNLRGGPTYQQMFVTQ